MAGNPTRRMVVVAGAVLVCLGLLAWVWTRTEGSATARATASARLEQLRAWGRANRASVVERLAEMVAAPSVAQNPDGVRELARSLDQELVQLGFETHNLASVGPPLILAIGPRSKSGRSLLLYAHYDGQNVDPERWTACPPFAPKLFDGSIDSGRELALGDASEDSRLCGRGAADDKGPIAVLLSVFEGLKELEVGPTSVTIKILLDGEEESGSPHLAQALADPEHSELLAAEAVVSLDGPVFQTGQPTLVFGVRGILTFDLVTFGGTGDLHSGHYGNWAPNPAQELAWLLSTMKDPLSGEITVADFYECREPLGEADEAALRAVPDVDQTLQNAFGLGRVERKFALKRAITYPSLNVRGLHAGDVGKAARTVIPATAEAAIDVRLVKGCTGDDMIARVRSHLEGLDYRVVTEEPSIDTRKSNERLVWLKRRGRGYDAVRTPVDWEVAAGVANAVERATGEPPIRLPTMGGSLPFYLFEHHLGMRFIGLPLVNHDNNQHGPNENVRVGHLWRGFDVLATVVLTFE